MKKLSLEELNRASKEEFKRIEKFPVVLLLDDIRSMSNVGSIFRTADCFKIEKILLCGICPCPPHREIEKTAIGATESVNWEYYESSEKAVLELKNNGYKLIALEQTTASIDLIDFSPEISEKFAFILGNEVMGVNEKLLPLVDYCIEIPQFGTKHSFNVAITGAIVLWDYYSKITGKLLK